MFAKQITVSTTSLNYDFALLTLQDPVPYGTARLALESGVGSQSYDLTTAGYSGKASSTAIGCKGLHGGWSCMLGFASV